MPQETLFSAISPKKPIRQLGIEIGPLTLGARSRTPVLGMRFTVGAGELDFRDFSGLLGEKENRIGIAQTLPLSSILRNLNSEDSMAIETVSNKLTNKEVEETLRSVIQSLIDGQEGFQQIGEHLKDETLRHYFAAESLKRAAFRGDLEEVLHLDGVHDVKESGTVGGAIQRTWGDIKAHLGGGDHTLLETTEAGEDSAKKAYEKALENELPLPIKQLLTKQYAHIQASHDYVKAARDSRK
jgi:uncharacterized protein (TIGR02284 family)